MKGQISRTPDIRYVMAIDTTGTPTNGPKPYGPWPPEKPIIGWDLPFYIVSDTPGVVNVFNPAPEQGNIWTHMLVLSFIGGNPKYEVWQQLNPGTASRQIQPLQDLIQGQDYSLTNSGTPAGSTITGPVTGPIDTIELRLVLQQRLGFTSAKLKELTQIEVNLVTMIRPPDSATTGNLTGWKLDQWFNQNIEYFPINLDPNAAPERRDALDASLLYPQNKPPQVPDDDVTFKGYASEVKEQK
ncbi:MAG: hypothetical protein FJZ00_00400 [Candidatus Sericytochromatia bacterium]|uniref:Uncharacterized protein n=1 Tax=Candidatus Tanganyikabacteria bacterium TaxID=2961651 RepID=A0A937X3D0_9BACT|nr:hypothetical protein [Candidatus Tanganyikabacteria bacterium]